MHGSYQRIYILLLNKDKFTTKVPKVIFLRHAFIYFHYNDINKFMSNVNKKVMVHIITKSNALIEHDSVLAIFKSKTTSTQLFQYKDPIECHKENKVIKEYYY